MNAKDKRNSFKKSDRSNAKAGKGNQAKKEPYTSKDGKKTDKFREADNRGNTSASNSPDWYGGSSPLMQNAAQLSFSTGAGRPVTIRSDRAPKQVAQLNHDGIMVLHTLNNPGYANDWNSPVNIAARKLYTFVRHVNSGHSNYDAVDLMMYIQLMDNAYSYYAWMVRVYGSMRTILLKNRFLPDVLVQSMGVSYSDIASRMADFRFYINLFATKLNQMAVPSTMPLFNRHMWMYSNVYADAPSERAQMYVFNPLAFWRYVVTDTDRYLEPTIRLPQITVEDYPSWTMDAIVSSGDVILNQILQREDFNIMSGDILKAYGDKLHRVNPIAEDYSVVPVYDPEVLLQIHNASVLDYNLNTSDGFANTWRVKEVLYDNADAGALYFNPHLKINAGTLSLTSDRIIDFPIEHPTSEHIAIATRLVAIVDGCTEYTDEGSSLKTMHFHALGTEIVLNTTLVGVDNTGVLAAHMIRFYEQFSVKDGQRYSYSGMPEHQAYHFEMRPLLWMLYYPYGESVDNTAYVAHVYGDLNNYAVLDHETLQNINEAAALAMYGVA